MLKRLLVLFVLLGLATDPAVTVPAGDVVALSDGTPQPPPPKP